MIWDWAFALETLPRLWEGLVMTIQASILASVGAIGLGLLWAIIRYTRVPVLSQVITVIVEFLRGTPMLVQLYFLFYVLPQYGITSNAFLTGVVGMSLYFSAYCAEVFRAGLTDVPKGQWEVAKALSLPPTHVWMSVILPQAMRSVIPPTGNYIVLMFKQSALLSTITVGELLSVARSIGSETYRYIEPLTMVGVLYFAISYPAAIGLRKLEERLATK